MRARALTPWFVVLSLVQAVYSAPPATGVNRTGPSTTPRTASRSYGTPRYNYNSRGPVKVQPQQTQRPQQAGSLMRQPPRVAAARGAAQPGVQVAATPSEARRVEHRRRLAEIQQQRDEALRIGDRRRLDDCDRLEHEARTVFAAEEMAAARAKMQRLPSRQVELDDSY